MTEVRQEREGGQAESGESLRVGSFNSRERARESEKTESADLPGRTQ